MFFPRCWKWSLCTILLCLAGVRDAAGGVLTLQWDPSHDSSVTGYTVFVGTESGRYSTTVNVGNQVQFVFRDAQPGSTYYFAVGAYRSDGVVGTLSAEVVGGIDVAPVLRISNPGDLTSVLGTAASVQLTATGPGSGSLTYAASGLPPGIGIDRATGSISGTPRVEGTYRVTATASSGSSAASEAFTWTIQRPVRAAPVVSVAIPTSDSTFTTSDVIILIGGTASDDRGVSAVYWTNGRGGSGRATGTDQWVAAVLLRSGRNDITITAVDGDSNRSQMQLSIYRKVNPRGQPPRGTRTD